MAFRGNPADPCGNRPLEGKIGALARGCFGPSQTARPYSLPRCPGRRLPSAAPGIAPGGPIGAAAGRQAPRLPRGRSRARGDPWSGRRPPGDRGRPEGPELIGVLTGDRSPSHMDDADLIPAVSMAPGMTPGNEPPGGGGQRRRHPRGRSCGPRLERPPRDRHGLAGNQGAGLHRSIQRTPATGPKSDLTNSHILFCYRPVTDKKTPRATDMMNSEQIQTRLGGRELVLKYKQGGVIDRERIYRSGDDDPETLRAIVLFFGLYARDKETQEFNLSTKIIGNGAMGVHPWVDPIQFQNALSAADASGNEAEANRIRHDWSAPIRIADVREGAGGIIYVDLEAS